MTASGSMCGAQAARLARSACAGIDSTTCRALRAPRPSRVANRGRVSSSSRAAWSSPSSRRSSASWGCHSRQKRLHIAGPSGRSSMYSTVSPAARAPTSPYGAQVPNGRRGGSSASCVGFPKLRRQREHPGCSWTGTHQRRETREPREFRPHGRHRRYRRRHGQPQRGDRPCADGACPGPPDQGGRLSPGHLGVRQHQQRPHQQGRVAGLHPDSRAPLEPARC